MINVRKVLFISLLFVLGIFTIDYLITWNIWDAIRKNRTWYVQRYLDKGSNIEQSHEILWKNGDNEYNITLLMKAARYGNFDVAQLLVNNGANVNATTTYNRTPLLFAARGGAENILQLLIERGADVNWNWTRGTSKSSSAPDILSQAIFSGCIGCVKKLLRAGAYVNQDHFNLASRLQYIDITTLLNDKLKNHSTSFQPLPYGHADGIG